MTRVAIGTLAALAATLVTGLLIAAPAGRVIFEGETISSKLSGKAFFLMTLKEDPGGEVSGKKVLAIPKYEAGKKPPKDEVQYKVRIPVTGKYYVWARVFWANGCGNSFYFKEGTKAGMMILGGDGTYNSLHWICLTDGGTKDPKPKALSLTKGVATFTLGAKESGSRVDQFLLTTDAEERPAGAYKPTKDAVVPPR